MQSNPYGLCVFVSYNTDEKHGSGERGFITTPIAYCPQLLAQLAFGKYPKYCDTALLSILKKNEVDYRPTLTIGRVEQREGYVAVGMKERDPLFLTTLEHLCECSQQGHNPRVLPVPKTTTYVANVPRLGWQ